MTRQDLAEAIKSVLAENTKSKLNESAIRQAVREVLAETVKLTADNIKYPFIGNTKNAILDKEYCDKVGINYNLGDSLNVDGTEFQVRSIIEPYFYVLTKLGSGEMNEEEYDLVRDIESALGRNPSEENLKKYLKIEPEDELPDDIKSAVYGPKSTRTPNYYNKKTGQAVKGKTRRIIGYKFGVQQYAWVWE